MIMKKKNKSAAKSASKTTFPDILGGQNPSHTTAGCPTGLGDLGQGQALDPPASGQRAGTGSQDPNVNASPGEGITEDEIERSTQRKDSPARTWANTLRGQQ